MNADITLQSVVLLLCEERDKLDRAIAAIRSSCEPEVRPKPKAAKAPKVEPVKRKKRRPSGRHVPYEKTIRGRVVTYLFTHGPLSCRDIARAIGEGKSATGSALWQAKKRGDVLQAGDGLWDVPRFGTKPAPDATPAASDGVSL